MIPPSFKELKYISQLGPAYNVFPTARHSRFEHTLGVVIMISLMWKALKENGFFSFLGIDAQDKLLTDLRIGALMHDIGHGPFSHVSEVVMDDFTLIQSEILKLSSKPHEVLGYYILRSDVFKALFDDLSKYYKISVNPDEISNYVIGRVDNSEEDQYKADLLNGQVDADKLDYIARDSDFSGVQLAVGIDRLLLSLGIEKIPAIAGKRNRKLILNEKGIMPLEQLLLAKIMLNSAIYHHQKVRAIDQMIIAILRRIIDQKIEIDGDQINSPIDFLRIDDFDILKLSSEDSKINEMCKALKRRQTFKRALVISPRTIEMDREGIFPNEFWNILQYGEYPSELRKLNKILAERIGKGCTEFDVAIDIPMTPKLGETQQKIIKMHDDFVTLKDVFPQKGWLDAYTANKWTGHVFAIEKYRKDARDKGKEIIEEKFDIKFNEYAIKDAKITPLYKKQRSLFDFG